MKIDKLLNNVKICKDGILNLVSEVCDKFNFEKIIDNAIDTSQGRPPEISYGKLVKMFIGSICDHHSPLYLMDKYFEDKDIKGLFGIDDVSKLNDQRFETMLDRFYEANPREIYSTLSISAYKEFGIEIKNINYDTTSKVMWGDYETPDGNISKVNITYGHSKQKRNDKKQIKVGIGTSSGFVVDAKVVDGNKDDKVYNKDNIDDANNLVNKLGLDKEKFHYVADSALFTKDTLDKLNQEDKKLLFITRAPNTINKVKEMINKVITNEEELEEIVLKNAHEKNVTYKIKECINEYEVLIEQIH